MGGSTNVQTPPTPNPGAADAAQLQAMINLAPQQFAAESQFDPQYAKLYTDIIGQVMPSVLQTYSQTAPQVQDLQNRLNTQQLQGNLGNLQNLGGSAVQAFQNANPQLAQIQGAMVHQATGQGPISQSQAPGNPMGYMQPWNSPQMNVQGSNIGWNPGSAYGAIQNGQLGQLNQMASQQLSLGGQLPSQTTADISNQVLSSMNTMGRATDPAAAANLALSLNSNQQQMLQQREAFAGQVAGLNQQQGQLGLGAAGLGLQGATSQAGLNQQANLSNQQAFLGQQGLQLQGGLGYGQQQLENNYYNQQAQGQNFGLMQGALGQANSAIMGTTMPALGTVLSPSTAFQGAGSLYGQAGGAGTGAQNFNPFPMGNSNFQMGYNAQYGPHGSSQFNAQNAQGMAGGAMNALGGMLGSGAMLGMFCWAAREAYGWKNPKWLKARRWMLTKAPADIREAYTQCGEYLAWQVAQSAELAETVRTWFDMNLQQEAA